MRHRSLHLSCALVVGCLRAFPGVEAIAEAAGAGETAEITRNVYLLPQADGTHRELFEDCRGYPLRGVATDRDGYAGLTERFVVFGRFATAPDLP